MKASVLRNDTGYMVVEDDIICGNRPRAMNEKKDVDKEYTMTIQDLLFFTIPDEMRKMTAEESAAYFPVAHEESYGLRNEEKHTIIAITCKKRPFLIGRAASLEACLKATEKNIKKKLPSYSNIGYGSKMVDGKEIPTFEFHYSVQGNKQMGKYGLCFSGNYFLAFEYICGEDYVGFAEQKYDELLSSVKFRLMEA